MIFYRLKNRYSGYGVEPFPTRATPVVILRSASTPSVTSSLGKDEAIILPDDSTSDKILAGEIGISEATPVNGESSLAVYEGSTMGEQVGNGTSADMVQVTEEDLTEKWWNWKSFAIGVGSGVGFCGLIWILSRMAKKGKGR